MVARSIASLTLSFGLVSIPVKLYSATEGASTVRFNLLAPDGSRLRQQYISEKDQSVVARADMVKGYEFEKDRFVLFTADELKALEQSSSQAVEIIAFIPERSVDPLYYDRAYLIAPDKRGGKPYTLLMQAMRQSGRCALARWSWKAKQHVVQIRPMEDGLVLQQLLYADEVRSLKDLDIELASVTDGELELALKLIEQISQDAYDPAEFEDEEKKRVLAAIDRKIAGKEVIASAHDEGATSGQVIDMMEALLASLKKKPSEKSSAPRKGAKASSVGASGEPAVGAPVDLPADAPAALRAALAAQTSGSKRASKAQPGSAAAVATVTAIDTTKTRKGPRRAARTESAPAAAPPASGARARK